MAIDIEELIRRQRANAQRIETPLLRTLRRQYIQALGVLAGRIDRLAGEIALVMASGGDATLALIERQRLELLARQVEAEITRLSRLAVVLIGQAQQVALLEGSAAARALLGDLTLGVSLNRVAVERIAAAFEAGSPLRDLAMRYGPDAAIRMRDAFVQGVILGQNPRLIARAANRALDEAMWRTLTTARTEVLRAYRGAALEQYRANADVVEGWIWLCAQDDRTCGMCWAMHGSWHPLSESFASHPNCRCSQSPAVMNVTRPVVPGAVAFEELPEASQLAVLGPAKFAAYNQNLITLNDLIGEGVHARWGPIRYERSLRSILGPQSAAFYRRAA